MKYIIESVEEPKRYWCKQGPIFGWTTDRTQASEFTEETRKLWHQIGTFPIPGGCWVITDEPEHLGDLFIRKDGNPDNNDISNLYIIPSELRGGIWHYTLEDFTRKCGNDEPNSKSTAITSNVTCPGCLRLMAVRHSFTTIKLRPVVIHLSTTKEWENKGQYEALNAQALEFEAAVRQFVMNQQVLRAPIWQVDVQEEE